MTKERENNRLKSAKLENIIERLKEELNLKCSEITHLTYRCEQSEQQIQADTPFTGEFFINFIFHKYLWCSNRVLTLIIKKNKLNCSRMKIKI